LVPKGIVITIHNFKKHLNEVRGHFTGLQHFWYASVDCAIAWMSFLFTGRLLIVCKIMVFSNPSTRLVYRTESSFKEKPSNQGVLYVTFAYYGGFLFH
jgi:hypothetical protein